MAAWHTATVASSTPETPSAARIVLDVDGWPGNEAGQHLDVRLTAEDGYTATRSYSIASAGPGQRVDLAVDRLPTGEVSPFLVDVLRPGDKLEVHGPLGGWFVWRPGAAGDPPVQLIGGGSGVVPLVAMLRAHHEAADATPFRLLYSVRTPDDVFFPEVLGTTEVSFVYTRRSPDGAPVGRLTREQLVASVFPAEQKPRIYLCGSTGFVETVAAWLIDAGHDAADIRTERFGGTS
ncbi:FAD-binding oxidoreductase [Rathayibacter sp. YIM 133350]